MAAILKHSGPWVTPDAQRPRPALYLGGWTPTASAYPLAQSQGWPVTPAGASSAPVEPSGAADGGRAPECILSLVLSRPPPGAPCHSLPASMAYARGLAGKSIPALAQMPRGTGLPLGLLESCSCWCLAGRQSTPHPCGLSALSPCVVPCWSYWIWGSCSGTGQQAHCVASCAVWP